MHIVDADPTGDRNAVPVVDAVVNDVVARLGEGIERKVVVTALGFLQEHHVGRPVGRPRNDLIDPGADRVDVPRGDPHPSGPYAVLADAWYGPARTPGSPDTTARTPKVGADCG